MGACQDGNGVVLLFFILLLIFAGCAWYNIGDFQKETERSYGLQNTIS